MYGLLDCPNEKKAGWRGIGAGGLLASPERIASAKDGNGQYFFGQANPGDGMEWGITMGVQGLQHARRLISGLESRGVSRE